LKNDGIYRDVIENKASDFNAEAITATMSLKTQSLTFPVTPDAKLRLRKLFVFNATDHKERQ
jgi:hypothetical protein